MAAIVGLVIPMSSTATTRIDRARIIAPSDFLIDENPPTCARGLWSDDAQAIMAIELNDLLSCRLKIKTANNLRLDRERQIDGYRSGILIQRQRVNALPDYPARMTDEQQIAQLLKRTECHGPMWRGYDTYIGGFVVEYRRLSRIMSIRSGSSIPAINLPC